MLSFYSEYNLELAFPWPLNGHSTVVGFLIFVNSSLVGNSDKYSMSLSRPLLIYSISLPSNYGVFFCLLLSLLPCELIFTLLL